MRRPALILAVAILATLLAPVASEAADTTPPRTTWTTRDGAVVVAPLDTLRGVSEDASSAIARVVVRTSGPWYCAPPGSRTCYTVGNPLAWRSSNATLACAPGARRCSWTAPVPLVPGEYLVQAYAVDAAGNSELSCWFAFCFAPQVRITVV